MNMSTGWESSGDQVRITAWRRCISLSGPATTTKIRSDGLAASRLRTPVSALFRCRLPNGRAPMLHGVRRGILGGTFDPPHLAHLFAGEAAYRDLGLDIVTFIPAGAPWQKAGRKVTSAEDRWQMTLLAIAGIPYFEADDREIRREGWTYTIDTLRSFPEGEELVLVLGADTARDIPTWREADAVLTRAMVAVVPRPGVETEDVDRALDEGRFVWLDTPPVRLSGTMLRRQASAGRSIRFLVRDGVWRYVEETGVYRRS